MVPQVTEIIPHHKLQRNGLLFPNVARRSQGARRDAFDNIADTAEDISVLFTMRPTEVPAEILEDLRRLVQVVVESCELIGNLSVVQGNYQNLHVAIA